MADPGIVPHMMPVVGSFLGAMLRGDESFLWTGRLVSLLDSQGSEGLGDATVTEFFCGLLAHCHVPSSSKPNVSSVFPIIDLICHCLKMSPSVTVAH